jgi:hypothetical protein
VSTVLTAVDGSPVTILFEMNEGSASTSSGSAPAFGPPTSSATITAATFTSSTPTIPPITTALTTLNLATPLNSLRGTPVTHTDSNYTSAGPLAVIPVADSTPGVLVTDSPAAECTMMATTEDGGQGTSTNSASVMTPSQVINQTDLSGPPWTNGSTGTGNGGILPTMPPDMLTVPAGVFFTGSWLGTGQAGATGTGYTNYSSNGTLTPTGGLSALGRTPVGPSVVVDASTSDASSLFTISLVTLAVVTGCVSMNV